MDKPHGACLSTGTGYSFVNRVKLPFEPNILAHYAGLAALQDHDFLRKTVANNEHGMEYLKTELDALGMKRIPSHANFILLEMGTAEEVTRVWDGVLRKGIAIRPLTSFGLPTCLRITIGTPQECELLIAALKAIL